jgi:hypothetical protein
MEEKPDCTGGGINTIGQAFETELVSVFLVS